MNSISERLLRGEKIPYSILSNFPEEALEFLAKWWEQADMSRLTRPHTLPDADRMLIHTCDKETVDTISGRLTFWKTLTRFLDEGAITRHHALNRAVFREQVVRCLADRSIKCGDGPSPCVHFTGGGYGAGKTSCLTWLAKHVQLDARLNLVCQQGVDYCKQLIPEFNMLKAVGDGRASSVCQQESRAISNRLFQVLVNERRCFSWDSSLSHYDESLEKFEFARKAGYRIGLAAVITDPAVAVKRAMGRAKELNRFAHPDFLLKSHHDFWECLPVYWNLMDSVYLIENTRDRDPRLLKSKSGPGDPWVDL